MLFGAAAIAAGVLARLAMHVADQATGGTVHQWQLKEAIAALDPLQGTLVSFNTCARLQALQFLVQCLNLLSHPNLKCIVIHGLLLSSWSWLPSFLKNGKVEMLGIQWNQTQNKQIQPDTQFL